MAKSLSEIAVPLDLELLKIIFVVKLVSVARSRFW